MSNNTPIILNAKTLIAISSKITLITTELSKIATNVEPNFDALRIRMQRDKLTRLRQAIDHNLIANRNDDSFSEYIIQRDLEARQNN